MVQNKLSDDVIKVKYDRKGVMISAFGSKFIEAIDSEPKIAVMQMTPQMKDNHLICGLDRVLIKIIKS